MENEVPAEVKGSRASGFRREDYPKEVHRASRSRKGHWRMSQIDSVASPGSFTPSGQPAGCLSRGFLRRSAASRGFVLNNRYLKEVPELGDDRTRLHYGDKRKTNAEIKGKTGESPHV